MASVKMNDLPNNLGAQSLKSHLSPMASDFYPESSPSIYPLPVPGSRPSSITKKTVNCSGSDKFAGLENMMRSKKPYAQTLNPSAGVLNGSPDDSTRLTTQTPAVRTKPPTLSNQAEKVQSKSRYSELPFLLDMNSIYDKDMERRLSLARTNFSSPQTAASQTASGHTQSSVLIDMNDIKEEMERGLSALKADLPSPQTVTSQTTAGYTESPAMVSSKSFEDLEHRLNLLKADVILLPTKPNRLAFSGSVEVDKDSAEKGTERRVDDFTALNASCQAKTSCSTSIGSTDGARLPNTLAKRPALSIQTETACPISSSTQSHTVTGTDSLDESIECRLDDLEANKTSQEMGDCMSEVSFVSPYSDMLSSIPDFGPPSVPSSVSDRLVATSPHQVLSNAEYDNGPIVRVSLDVWDKIMKEMSALKKERYGIPESYNRRQDPEEVHRIAYEIEQNTGWACYQLDQTKNYNAEMTRALRQKDIEINHKDLGIKLLEEQVNKHKANIEKLTKCNHELKYNQNHPISSTEVASLTNEITELKAQIARSKIVSTHQTTRANNLVEIQVQREKKMKQLDEKLLEAQNAKRKLQDKYDDLRESLPSKQVFLEVQTKLANKTSECDRMRNELRMVIRQRDLAQKGLDASQGRKALSGACHLVVPKPTTVLPRNVYPCMECAIKNIDCDDRARCTHCFNAEEHCQRWRCSIHHIAGPCNHTPCRVFHDANGWLLSRVERSQW